MRAETAIFALALFVIEAKANKQLFLQFQVDHGKLYLTPEEHEYRYQIFASNLQKINEHNEKFNAAVVSWELGINQFTDLTTEEFQNFLGTYAAVNLSSKGEYITYEAPLDVSAPAAIDWRSHGAVTAVKNQGNCGGCWSFSATGTTEGQYFTKKGKLVSLSEQQLLDCATCNSGYSCNGCSGGVIQSALDYARDHGLESEAEYPYKAKKNGACSAVTSKIVVKTKGFTGIQAFNENDLKSAVGLEGPVSVAVNANLWQHYKSGIFANTSCSTEVNHGVTAVGYGSQSGINYWLIKNSWGTVFGEQGYIKMAMGHNLCGIANQACYPHF